MSLTPTRLLSVSAVCLVLGLICLALILSGCSLRSAQIAHVTAQSLDMASTKYAESHGAVERNPLMPSGWPMRIAVKGAATAGVIWMTEALSDHGHSKAAKVVATTINLILAGAVISNVVQR